MLLARVQELRRPQQAANMLGTKGRTGSWAHETSGSGHVGLGELCGTVPHAAAARKSLVAAVTHLIVALI